MSNLYRVKTGTGATPSGTELLDVLAQLNDGFARLKLIRKAMIEQKGNDADYAVPSVVFQFVNAAGAVDEPTAAAAFAELDSFVTAAGPSLEQACARFKQ